MFVDNQLEASRKMKALVTGGAGFIGRWVVAELLDRGLEVIVLDNLSNGSEKNLDEFRGDGRFKDLVVGDINDSGLVGRLFAKGIDICAHLAARVNVQDSIEEPALTFKADLFGTFNLLEESRRRGAKFIFTSSCMVYDEAPQDGAIGEGHPIKVLSPYAASKLASEAAVLAYYRTYGVPTLVLRPFNTYGPFQKSTGEGGVISIFLSKAIRGEPLRIYGDGDQTRDFLYAADCARFVADAALSDGLFGEVINAGSGRDISINDLARLICPGGALHVPHIHPQCEIRKLRCNAEKARKTLGWKPKVAFEEGLKLTREWIERQAAFQGKEER